MTLCLYLYWQKLGVTPSAESNFLRDHFFFQNFSTILVFVYMRDNESWVPLLYFWNVLHSLIFDTPRSLSSVGKHGIPTRQGYLLRDTKMAHEIRGAAFYFQHTLSFIARYAFNLNNLFIYYKDIRQFHFLPRYGNDWLHRRNEKGMSAKLPCSRWDFVSRWELYLSHSKGNPETEDKNDKTTQSSLSDLGVVVSFLSFSGFLVKWVNASSAAY